MNRIKKILTNLKFLLEKKLNDLSNQIITIIYFYLISSNKESKVFNLKIKGDYNWYL